MTRFFAFGLFALFLGLPYLGFTQNAWRTLQGPPVADVYSITYDSTGLLLAGTGDGIYYLEGGANTWKAFEQEGLRYKKVFAIAITKQNYYIVGTDSGIYYSQNAKQWLNVNANLPAEAVTALAYLPESNTWLAGTESRGLQASTNDGQQWQSVSGLNQTFAVKNIKAISVGQDARVWVATDQEGVFWANDYTQTWERLVSGLEGRKVNSVFPYRSDTLFAATNSGIYILPKGQDSWQFLPGLSQSILALALAEDGQSLVAAAETGVLFHSNTIFQGWLPYFALPTANPFYCLIRAKDGTYWAGSLRNGIFKSNNGANWVDAQNGLANANVQALAAPDTALIYALVRGAGVFKTTDSGESWQKMITGLGSLQVNDIWAYNKDTLIVGTTGASKVYRTTNGGNTWFPTGGNINAIGVNCLLAAPNSKMYAGTFDKGVFVSSELGTNWQAFPTQGLNNLNISALVYWQQTIYAGTFGGGIFRFVNQSWEGLNTGLEGGQVTAFAVANNLLFAATVNGIFVLKPNNIWELSHNFSGTNTYITDLVVNGRGEIFAATSDAGVWKSADNGKNWIEYNEGLADFRLKSLAINAKQQLVAGAFFSGVHLSTPTYNVSRTKLLDIQNWVTIYPNPASSILNLNFSKPLKQYSVEIFNLLGKLIFTTVGEYNTNLSLEIEYLPAGVYLLKVNTPEGQFLTQSFIKN